jgi:hypothetical protein
VYKGFQGINSFVMEEKRVYEIIRGLQTTTGNTDTSLAGGYPYKWNINDAICPSTLNWVLLVCIANTG